ncbi:TVP38/TMEM64 family protein [Tepidibacter formicigenes]|uniref:TVP38/TMEM64 family membrane protein n=1 Tax=Tepidibacter formicigenes DSM 15518 TaxID=1123349 RepID=A0A1M6PZ63_9FIRM|nr:TVP38/TMEM64 family protein [Tepidibacter formicigenes]SHK13156.1 Uncharacterized membrane protein YdjX, TVP38/TMEM64 family, SNARE-associated domain [Tepidibacter formicigenes DSM 15518]
MKKIKESKELKKCIIIFGVIITIVLSIKFLGFFEYMSLENIQKIKIWIQGYKVIGPIIYMILFIFSCIFFLPAPPMAILAGLAFGPVMGTVWTGLAAIISDSAAFLIARYAAGDIMQKLIEENKVLKKIDDGVQKHGWRLLIFTRLVPGFPYMLQSYAYGLTNISFRSYIIISWICTVPGIIAFTFMGGALVTGKGDIGKTFGYFGIGALVFIILSLIPGLIKKNKVEVVDE